MIPQDQPDKGCPKSLTQVEVSSRLQTRLVNRNVTSGADSASMTSPAIYFFFPSFLVNTPDVLFILLQVFFFFVFHSTVFSSSSSSPHPMYPTQPQRQPSRRSLHSSDVDGAYLTTSSTLTPVLDTCSSLSTYRLLPGHSIYPCSIVREPGKARGFRFASVPFLGLVF